MPLDISTQAIIAFKNLLGKSNTDATNKSVNNEFEGIGFTITGGNVWIETIDPTPSVAVAANVAVAVSCSTILDATSNGHALFAVWPLVAPTGTDPKTGLAFTYGTGTLVNINAGDRVTGAIPDTFGIGYLAQPKFGGNAIPVGDQRDWIYQYNSGIFFQEEGSNEAWGGSSYGHPDQIDLYVYIGNTVLDVTGGGNSEWYASVTSIECNPPVSPSTGDRYLICPGPSPAATGDWTGFENKIAQWSGVAWIYTEPTQGGTVQIDDEPGVYYLYVGDDYPNGTWTRVPSTIVRIGVAAGTDTYTGTVDPPILNYTNVIFIGVFDNANTGASTMNINSLGVVPIKKKDGASLVDLDAGDIQVGIMYMMVHDGTVFQLYTGDIDTPTLQEVLTEGSSYIGSATTSITSTTGDFIFNAVAGDFTATVPAGTILLDTSSGGGSIYTQDLSSISLSNSSGFSEIGNITITDSIDISSVGTGLTSIASISYSAISLSRNTGSDIQSFIINGTGITIRDDENSKGAEYLADYTANFTEHSLVTKGYVDAQISLEDLWDQVGNDIQTAGQFSPNIPNVLPRYNDLQDLGSATKRWKDLYLGSVIDCATNLDINVSGSTAVTIDTTGIILPSNKVITAASGGGQLNLRAGGDDVVDLTNDNGGYTQAWFYGDGASAQLGFGTGGYVYAASTGLSLNSNFAQDSVINIQSAGIVLRAGGNSIIKIQDNTAGVVTSSALVQFPASIVSQGSTISQNVTNSVILGGTNIIAKTNNTAYATQFGFSQSPLGGPFDLILNAAAINADRTQSFQNADGTIALLTDITSALAAYLKLDGSTPMTGDLDMLTNSVAVRTNEIETSAGRLDWTTGLDALIHDFTAWVGGGGATFTQTWRGKSGTVAHLDDITGTKYVEEFIPGTVGVANTITHGLASEDLIVQLWHNNKLITANTVEVIDTNNIEITFTGSNPAEVSPALVKVTIIRI